MAAEREVPFLDSLLMGLEASSTARKCYSAKATVRSQAAAAAAAHPSNDWHTQLARTLEVRLRQGQGTGKKASIYALASCHGQGAASTDQIRLKIVVKELTGG